MSTRLKYRDLLALALAGILPVGAPIGVAPLIRYAGASAIWAVLLGYAMVVLSAVPVLEYSRLARFSGGYYGLAELGLGLAAGKYTALMNYIYYLAWQAQNALQAGWVVYSMTNDIRAWLVAAIGVLLLSFLGASSPPRRYAERLLLPVITATTGLTVALDVYVLSASPYRSPSPLAPPADWGPVALAAAVQGFWLFVGYGTPLFYSEEAERPFSDVWRAIVAATALSAAVYLLSAYAIISAVPPADLNALVNSPMPYMDAWSRYLPQWALFLYPLALAPALLAYGGPAGSHARLLWAMARDGFIGHEKLREVRGGVPRNAALFNLALSAATAFGASTLTFALFGTSPVAAEEAWLEVSTAATVLWYFHHVPPELALYPLLRRRPGLVKSRAEAVLTGALAPAAGLAIFIYTLYHTAAYRSYLPAVCASLIIAATALVYTLIRRAEGRLGSSTAAYLLA
ncbi:MAG: APC family permease, partial [Thermoproteus sp.]